jgi:hypothetical protein
MLVEIRRLARRCSIPRLRVISGEIRIASQLGGNIDRVGNYFKISASKTTRLPTFT